MACPSWPSSQFHHICDSGASYGACGVRVASFLVDGASWVEPCLAVARRRREVERSRDSLVEAFHLGVVHILASLVEELRRGRLEGAFLLVVACRLVEEHILEAHSQEEVHLLEVEHNQVVGLLEEGSLLAVDNLAYLKFNYI